MVTTAEQLDDSQISLLPNHVGEMTTRITLTFTSETYQQHYLMCLQKKARSAKFEGFRVGKAPLEMVEARYRNALQKDALNATIEATIYQYLEEKKPLLASSPKIVSALRHNAERKLHQFDFEFEEFPSVKIKKLTGQTFILPTTQVSDKIIDILHQDFLYARASRYEKSQNAAAPHDHVTFSVALAAQKESSAEPQALYFGIVQQWLSKTHSCIVPKENSLIGLFEPTLIGTLSQESEEIRSDQLDFSLFLGLKQGESQKTVLKIDNHSIPVEVTVEEIQTPIIEELSPKEFKKLGCSFEDKESFANFLLEQTRFQIAIFRRHKLKQALFEFLKKEYADISIPKNFFARALTRIALPLTVDDRKALLSKPAQEWSESQRQAAKEVCNKALPNVILNALCARYNINISPKEINGLVQQSELAMKQRGFSLHLHKDAKQTYISMMHQYVLEEKMIQLCEAYSRCIEPEINFEEFLIYAKTGKLPEHLNLQELLGESAQNEPLSQSEAPAESSLTEESAPSKASKKPRKRAATRSSGEEGASILEENAANPRAKRASKSQKDLKVSSSVKKSD